MNLVVRPVDPARDAKALADIYAPYVTDSAVSFELVAPDAETMAARARACLDEGRHWLIAESAGRCIGYVYGARFRERPAYDATVETAAYLAREAQRCGIGRALYGALFARLAADGKTRAIAVVTLPNSASVTFHEKVGFTLAGRLADVGYKLGRNWDVGLFQRAITASDALV